MIYLVLRRPILGGLLSAKGSLGQFLDTATKGEYANARKIAATKPQLHEAMDFGRSIFNSKLLPEEVQAHIADLSMPEAAMVQVGARRELERTLSNVRNESAKARSFLDTNNNLAKISASIRTSRRQTAISARIAWRQRIHSSRLPRKSSLETHERQSVQNSPKIQHHLIHRTFTQLSSGLSARLLPHH